MKNEQAYFQSLFNKSAMALQTGDYRVAKKGFEKITKKIGNNASVWYNLGLSNQYLNDHRSAIQAFNKVLKINPKMLDARVNLALSHDLMGNQKTAFDIVCDVLAADKNHFRAIMLHGSLLAVQGKPKEARESLIRAHELNPNDEEAQFNLANIELTSGNPSAAMALTAPLLRSHPREFKYLELQTQIHIHLEEFDSAAAIMDQLKAMDKKNESIEWLDLSLREASKSHFHVIELCESLIKRHPKDAQLWNSLGNAYFQLDSIDKASSAYQKALDIMPDHAEFLSNRGLAYASVGDKENAERYYRMSIEANPEYAETYRNLVTMKRFQSLEDPDAVTLLKLWENNRGEDHNETIGLAFALGKVYDDCGDYEKSFETYQIGNDLRFAESKINIEAYLSHIDRIPSVLNYVPDVVSLNENVRKPIFVLGMPRSGTTLVEQILSRHSDVTGCGELPCIERAITRLEKGANPGRAYPDDFTKLGETELTNEAAFYHEWVSKLHFIETPFFVDKMPFNFVHIWLIKSLFPESPIVNCQRHPLDVILSNYFQIYGSDVSFVYNLEALTHYYLRYSKLMRQWNGIFQDQIYNVVYESLVTDHEHQTRKLVEGVGLPWDEGCLESNKGNAVVRTASIWQVRQGIYTRSKERWRNYEEQLRPAADILVEEGVLDEQWMVKG